MLVNPWVFVLGTAALIALIGFTVRRWPVVKPRILAVIFGVALLLALVQFPPAMSKWSGEAAEITMAWGIIAPGGQNYGGIWYDRNFDWPTGEAFWIDFPAWWLHLALFCCAVSCGFMHYCRLHRKTPLTPQMMETRS